MIHISFLREVEKLFPSRLTAESGSVCNPIIAVASAPAFNVNRNSNLGYETFERAEKFSVCASRQTALAELMKLFDFLFEADHGATRRRNLMDFRAHHPISRNNRLSGIVRQVISINFNGVRRIGGKVLKESGKAGFPQSFVFLWFLCKQLSCERRQIFVEGGL